MQAYLGGLATRPCRMTSLPLLLGACEKATHIPCLESQALVETCRCSQDSSDVGNWCQFVLFLCPEALSESTELLPVGLGRILSRHRPVLLLFSSLT